MRDRKKPSMGISSKIIYTLAVVSGLAALLAFYYPTIADAWNRYAASRRISDYISQTGENRDYTEDLAAARAYNQALYAAGNNHISEYTERMEAEGFRDVEYENLVNKNGDLMMGYIDITSIGVSLPIYHYATEDVMETSIGHLYGTSLPVGGESTHAALTGHSGLMSARIFTDLEKLKEGDIFTLHTLGQSLNYEVDQISVVLPDELEGLSIEEGKDLVTLITCTPYGVNTHRLLVRGHRTSDSSEAQEKDTKQTLQEAVSFPATIFAVALICLLAGIVIIIRIWRS